jgi:hypothetical protein
MPFLISTQFRFTKARLTFTRLTILYLQVWVNARFLLYQITLLYPRIVEAWIQVRLMFTRPTFLLLQVWIQVRLMFPNPTTSHLPISRRAKPAEYACEGAARGVS